jgi:hypothetical protein
LATAKKMHKKAGVFLDKKPIRQEAACFSGKADV